MISRGPIPAAVNKFKQLTFRNKLIFSIFVSIIPLFLLQSFSFYNSKLSIEKKVSQLVDLHLEQTANNLENTLHPYFDTITQIYIDDEMIDAVRRINERDETERALAFNLINRKLNYIANSNQGIRSIAIFAANGRIAFYDAASPSSVVSIWDNDRLQSTKATIKSLRNNHTILLPAKFVDRINNQKYYLFHVVKKMYDFRNMDLNSIGTIVISVDESILNHNINKDGDSSRNKNRLKSINLIHDQAGNIISFPNKELIGTNIHQFETAQQNANPDQKYSNLLDKAAIFKGRRVIINKLVDKRTKWVIVNVVDQDFLFSDIYWLQKLSLILAAVAIAMSLFIIFYISNSFSKSIQLILKAMKIAQGGELSVQIELDEHDEISAIASRFNKMIAKINQLVEDVKQATHKQKEAEIRALEAQINPHFLYNTLDSINWMAIEKEEYQISKMLENLANILRYNISNSNKLTTFREEAEWLKQYIFLQQNRFDHSFECWIDIPETVLECKIYKLLLQPFIENAIIHGFAGIAGGGILKIDVKSREDDRISITIADNGHGMAEEVLEELEQPIANDLRYGRHGIGILNALSRLQIYYGAGYQCRIKSEPGQGTSVSLLVPKIL